MAGVKRLAVSYGKGSALIDYSEEEVSLEHIERAIEKLGYKVVSKKVGANIGRAIGILGIIVALYFLLEHFGVLNLLVPAQLAETKMGYGMLFVIGLITSIHCIAMCGGINLSQSISGKRESGFLYNLGRVISYTVIGFILGLIGWLFGGGDTAGLPVEAQGFLKILAGVVMVLMGMNMLGIFPALRRLNPRIPMFIANKAKGKNKGPLIVGLLNGFMPCGPLQSMQIVALATANPLAGALSMFLFSLGTVPLMLGLGTLVATLGQRFAKSVMTVGAVLVVVLGLAMLSQGGSISGIMSQEAIFKIVIILSTVGIVSLIPFERKWKKVALTTGTAAVIISLLLFLSPTTQAESKVEIIDGKQMISSTLSANTYPSITVKKDAPVKWSIYAQEENINGCNNRIFIDEYGIEYTFKPGDNLIEFIPTKTGTFQYSCWMGMIRATINVVE